MGARTRRSREQPLRPPAPALSRSGGALPAVLVLLALPAAWGEMRAGGRAWGAAPAGSTDPGVSFSGGLILREGDALCDLRPAWPRARAGFPCAGSYAVPSAGEGER
ncbi:unnamed protein product [Pipistrellus nathusii]|uniref:Uncharacterized protein n=1 Tax=Pipistrellus nathusii TaxID=59473 RepID=A0ABN9ZND9_PIPNA